MSLLHCSLCCLQVGYQAISGATIQEVILIQLSHSAYQLVHEKFRFKEIKYKQTNTRCRFTGCFEYRWSSTLFPDYVSLGRFRLPPLTQFHSLATSSTAWCPHNRAPLASYFSWIGEQLLIETHLVCTLKWSYFFLGCICHVSTYSLLCRYNPISFNVRLSIALHAQLAWLIFCPILVHIWGWCNIDLSQWVDKLHTFIRFIGLDVRLNVWGQHRLTYSDTGCKMQKFWAIICPKADR